MESLDIVVVYHPNCKPSCDLLPRAAKLSNNANIEYINLKDDKIDSEIIIDTIPLVIINNDPNKVFKGRQAFEKIDSLCASFSSKPAKDINTPPYTKMVQFKEDTSSKKEKIDLSKK